MSRRVKIQKKKVAKKGRLTPKQERWCEEYLIDLNATQAAIRAGYSLRNAKQQGTENLAKHSLMDIVDKAIAARGHRTEVTADQVLLDLREVADVCMGRRTVPNGVLVDGKLLGDKVVEFNAAAANKSLELLGKHFRMFADVHVHEHSIEDMTDEELIEYEAKIDAELQQLSAKTVH